MKPDFATSTALICLALLTSACSTPPPNAPSVMVLPGSGKDFQQFRADNELCRQFASEQLNNAGGESAISASGIGSTALGTALGAAAGAAINGGRGAAAGAGGGFALGGLAGVDAAQTTAGRLQQRYDISYQQCMYANGHRIPSGGGIMGQFFNGYSERPPNSPPIR
jgi:hypothetical protein